MNVLLINGSPHEKGCTYTALSLIAGELNASGIETEILNVGTKPVGGCIGCGGCAAGKGCVFGGVVNEAIEKAKTADAFVFGTPVHYASASGNMTSFMDRLAYAGNNQDVTLVKNSSGDWMLESDPTLPLDQTKTASLVESYANLTAQRKLEGSDLTDLPEKSATPQMTIAIGAGEESVSLTVDQLNSVADVYYIYDDTGAAYTVKRSDLATLSKSARDLYKAQTLTDKTLDDVVSMQMNDLDFTQTDGSWTLTNDTGYALNQSSVKKMVNTILQMQTAWTITTPDADSAYGLDDPDVTATLTFTDGTSLTVRFGTEATDTTDSLCYLASDAAPTVVYEVNADHKAAFAVTKETLHDATATAETAATTDVVAQYPVGGENDYAASLPD